MIESDEEEDADGDDVVPMGELRGDDTLTFGGRPRDRAARSIAANRSTLRISVDEVDGGGGVVVVRVGGDEDFSSRDVMCTSFAFLHSG